MQTKTRFIRNSCMFVLIYFALASLFYWIIKDDWRTSFMTSDTVNRDALLPEMTENDEILQEFKIASDHLNKITLQGNKLPGATDDSCLKVELREENNTILTAAISYSEIGPDGTITIDITDPMPPKGTQVTLVLHGQGKLALWYGSTRSAGKFNIDVATEKLQLNGEPVEGELVLSQSGSNDLPYTGYYWPVAAVVFILLTAAIIYTHSCFVRGKDTLIHRGWRLVSQYQYLLKTLVIRDFKIKYKASMLGVLWSFLNPLLMTFVYMFVFSTLFRSSIENFVVYLMSGIILFNYFSEATNLGMQSIVGNAALITKVYMPKYIFPISKVLSSGINLVISLIPLLIMMALTGVRFSKSLLLLPLVLLFLILFCVGVSLILSAAMVYFRDIQFLWGIFITILNFLSPIFYPESIIPARFQTLYHLNPMYQYLFFMRTITLGGISPTPVTYVYCILASGAALLLGLYIFHKAQSNFVLHL